jgi:Protein of unknown function (DUF1688)
MGLFNRKGSKPSTYDNENIKKPQTAIGYQSAKSSEIPISLNQPNAAFSRARHNMSINNISLSKPPDPGLDPAAYLKSIHAVREQSKFVVEKAKSNELSHFDVNMDMFQNTADYVVSIIKVNVYLVLPLCTLDQPCAAWAELMPSLARLRR